MNFKKEFAKFNNSSGVKRSSLLRSQGRLFDQFLVFETSIGEDAFGYLTRVLVDEKNVKLDGLSEFTIALETEFQKLSDIQKQQFIILIEKFCKLDSSDLNKLALADLFARQYPFEFSIGFFKKLSELNSQGRRFAFHGYQTLLRMLDVPPEIKERVRQLVDNQDIQ